MVPWGVTHPENLHCFKLLGGCYIGPNKSYIYFGLWYYLSYDDYVSDSNSYSGVELRP